MMRRLFELPGLLVFAALLVGHSLQQQDPLSNFCRRFGHQTAIVDRKLYIDGGLWNSADFKTNPANYTMPGLWYADLDNVNDEKFPIVHNDLNKNATIPTVHGGVLWPDTVNKLLYLYGGEFYGSAAQSFVLWAYDIVYNTWNATQPADYTKLPKRASYGAGAVAQDKARGFYYGGWLSNASDPSVTDKKALSSMLTYDMLTRQWNTIEGPDDVGRAEGTMLYVPVSDAGMLVYFGGVKTPYSNDSWVGEPLTNIYLYDIANAKWYKQTATGDVPDMRRRFCADVTWAPDQSSYNIYLYGGASMPPYTVGFDDLYILSMPSFKWLKWYPEQPGQSFPHHSLSCNIIEGAQMIVMGGSFPNSSECDVPKIFGMHNANLGKQNPDNAKWFQYMKDLKTYKVPSEIVAAIGGGSQGGATQLKPESDFDQNDLKTYFTRKYTAGPGSRTATRPIPTASSTAPPPSPPPKKSNAGAIAGGVVGGVVVLIACCAVVFFCLRMRKKKREQQQPEFQTVQPGMSQRNTYTGPSQPVAAPVLPPAELPAEQGQWELSPTSPRDRKDAVLHEYQSVSPSLGSHGHTSPHHSPRQSPRPGEPGFPIYDEHRGSMGMAPAYSATPSYPFPHGQPQPQQYAAHPQQQQHHYTPPAADQIYPYPSPHHSQSSPPAPYHSQPSPPAPYHPQPYATPPPAVQQHSWPSQQYFAQNPPQSGPPASPPANTEHPYVSSPSLAQGQGQGRTPSPNLGSRELTGGK